jgi:hypothetical protein
MSTRENQSSDVMSDEMVPDTFVLLKSVEGMLNLVETQAQLYGDARRRLVDEHLKSVQL